MDWLRYIKRTAVRRVVWIVVGLLVYAVLSAFGVAHAQASGIYPTREDAYDACMAEVAGGPSNWSASNPCLRDWAGGNRYCINTIFNPPPFGNSCSGYQGSRNWFVWEEECPAGTNWNEDLKQCAAACTNLSPLEGNFNTSREPIQPSYCVSGCTYNATDPMCHMVEAGPTAGYWCNVVYNPTGGQCEAGPETPPNNPDDPPRECAAGEVRLPNGQCSPRGECPLGQHEVNGACYPIGNCPIGHVKAPDGSCVAGSCPAGQARGADGTCKADSDGDGTPDEDEEGGEGSNKDGMEFSGGESCDVPPTCSGDAIMCGQARIQWRIDCNTRKMTGGHGGAGCSPMDMPICAGADCDWLEHQQLVQAWKAACALQSLVDRDGDGDGDGVGPPADMDIEGVGIGAADGASGTAGDGGDPGGAFSDGSEGGDGSGELDTSGLGFGTACPSLPSVDVFGTTLDFNVIGPKLCDWMSLGGYIVLILSSLLSLRILAGGMNV